MNGSAPKSPETGSQAWRVKNFQPNWTRLRWERRTRMLRMKRTMAKMLQAQTSMTAAKLLSAIRPLPRWFRYARMAETGAPAKAGSRPAAKVAGGASTGGGRGVEDPGSRSVVMWLEDTIPIPVGLSLGADCICPAPWSRTNKGAARNSEET